VTFLTVKQNAIIDSVLVWPDYYRDSLCVMLLWSIIIEHYHAVFSPRLL